MSRVKLNKTRINGVYWYRQDRKKKYAYRHRYYDQHKKRREKSERGFESMESAERALIDVKAAILDGNKSFVENDNMTVSQLNDIYIEANIPNWKPTSKRGHVYHMEKYVLDVLGKKKIKNVNNMMVQNELINPLIIEGYAENTLLSIYRRLNAIFMYAVKNELIERKRFTTPNFKGAAEGEKRRALTLEEVNKFLGVTKEKYKITHYTAFTLLFLTGMRSGELRALQWSDVDFEKNILHIRKTKDRYGARSPKTKNSVRTFPMGKNIRNLLLEYRKWYDDKMARFGFRNPDNRLLITYAGEPIGEFFLKRTIDLICKRENIERFTPHYFRHTFVTLQLSNKIPISTVAALVGDTPETIYKVYAHSFSKDESEAIDLMDDIVDLQSHQNKKE